MYQLKELSIFPSKLGIYSYILNWNKIENYGEIPICLPSHFGIEQPQ